MTQPEGPGEPEFVETDLSQDEGLPTTRADIAPIARDRGETQKSGEGSAPGEKGGRRLSDVSFLFRVPGMRVRMRNRSSEDSPTHRAMAASLPIAVTLIAAIVFAKLFLASMNPTMAALIIVLIVIVGFYVALRVIAEPVKTKPVKTKNTEAKGKRKGG